MPDKLIVHAVSDADADADVDVERANVRKKMEGAYALRAPLRVDLRSGKNWPEVHCVR